MGLALNTAKKEGNLVFFMNKNEGFPTSEIKLFTWIKLKNKPRVFVLLQNKLEVENV